MIKIDNRYKQQGATKKIVTSAKNSTNLKDSASYQNGQKNRMESLSSNLGKVGTNDLLTSLSDSTPNVASTPLNIDTDPLMDGMDYDLQDKILFNVYRDMYWHDPVCGSAVDMFSSLPFSEFSIGGAADKHLDPYREAVEVLNLRNIFPEISIDYKVTGGFCGSLLHNRQSKKFIDLMCHRMDSLEINPLFAYGQDPIIILEMDRALKRTLSMESPRVERLKRSVGEEFFNKLMHDRLELDPVGTLYIPRKTFSHSGPTSYFKRVLPIWLIEKNLYRGTLIESGRRQRGIMHLQLGDGDMWEPSEDDFNHIAGMFNNADADPIGAVVATRLGVAVDELRQGGDFWKVTDLWNETTYVKMRALGISEAFLSGDASYANMEGSLTVFVESIRTYRDMLTRRVFYSKVFPLVSMMQGNTINKRGKIIKQQGLMQQDSEDILRTMNDGSKLFIPTVHWAKQLKPEADQTYMEMLRQLQEMGVPVPLRALAAAGGFNLDSLINNREEDLALQKQINSYQDELGKLKGEGGGAEEDAGFGGFASVNQPTGFKSRVLDGYSRRPTLLDRDFGEASEIYSLSKTGKKRHVFRQAEANRRANEKIERAMRTLDANDPKMKHLFSGSATDINEQQAPRTSTAPKRRKRTTQSTARRPFRR